MNLVGWGTETEYDNSSCRTSKRFVLFWESKVIAQASFAEGVRRRLLPRRTVQRLLSMLSERNSCMAPHPGLTSDARSGFKDTYWEKSWQVKPMSRYDIYSLVFVEPGALARVSKNFAIS